MTTVRFSRRRGSSVVIGVVAGLLAVSRTSQAQRATPRFEILPAGGLHFLGAQRASLALGVLAVPYGGQSRFAFVALAEPGIGGAKLRAGIASVTGFITGFELQGTVLRTFGNPRQGDPWRTYAGGEAHAMFVLLNVGVGAYAPLGGGSALATWTIGFGL
jgi:hypothetical protein